MRKLLLALTFVGGLIAPAFGQSVIQDNLSGNECWNSGQGPGGPSTGWLCSNTVRNSWAKAATTVSASATLGVTAGLTALRQGGNLIITAQPLAATITLPPNPVPDGALIGVCNPTAAPFATNVVTLAPNTGQTLTGGNITLTTLGAVTCVRVQFNRSNTTWYRIQ